MNDDLRASLLVGAVAAGLSMLVGLVSRVPFLSILFRALLFGAVFGGLAWGTARLFRSFLPEIFETKAGLAETLQGGNRAERGDGIADRALGPDAGDSALGNAVDIVLDDEGEDESRSRSVLFGPESEELEEIQVAEGGLGAILDVEPRGEAGSPSQAGADSAGLAKAAKPTSAALPARSSTGIEELDMLPDLDSLSDSFGSLDLGSAAPTATTDTQPAHAAGGRGHAGAPFTGPGAADPAALAMAVRTLLKRDQKG